jgi:tRNA threonylcarbamoyladenosine biosynthesis protein TsaB
MQVSKLLPPQAGNARNRDCHSRESGNPESAFPLKTWPTLLSFDTATQTVYLSVNHQNRVWTDVVVGGAQASATLLPAIDVLLARANLTLHDVHAIGFGQGPGAFTGLRVACAVAQGMALALDIPVLALDTLLAVAEQARQQISMDNESITTAENPIFWALQDARMGQIYAAAYQYRSQERIWNTMAAPMLLDPAALVEEIRRSQVSSPDALLVLAGNALEVEGYAALLALLPYPRCPFAVPAGDALAALAQAAWDAGAQQDPALALPVYVRDKVAQTTAERAAERAP